jgi:uncharacterized iron-regulated membrane protein
MKPWLLKIHRWLALIFAIPLLVVIGTGLILSFEPWLVTRTIAPGTLTAEKVEALLAQHDPKHEARAIAHRSYDATLTVGAGRGGKTIDTAGGQVRAPSPLATLLGTTRQLHERFMIDADWLTITSTIVMLTLIVLGILMGWPRLSNSLSGWHKTIAWCLLPFVILSPLTGLMMANGITFATPATSTKEAPLALADAVRVVARDHDLSALIWIRQRGGRTLARLSKDGEYRVYAVSAQGATRQPRNWPRLWHEGNFAGGWSSAMNAVLSLALLSLLVTGVWMWSRRQLTRHARRLPTGAPQVIT